jgi:competence protein ComEA
MDPPTSANPGIVAPPQGQAPIALAWPRSAQLATAFLLGVATTLLAIHACRGLRWGSRPTQLERSGFVAYRIDLNRADRALLLQVPGIGDSLAQRIEDHRRQHGAFQNFSDLRQVQGVGPTTLERLRPWLEIPSAEADSPPSAITKRLPTSGNSKKEGKLTSPVDINRATLAELQSLPTVGQKRAQLIVEERQKRPFTSVEDLRRVPGIGAKTLERLRPYIVVDQGGVRIVTQVDR